MEKYKYCNIGPASSPRVGGREGGRRVQFTGRRDNARLRYLENFFFICSDENVLAMH